MTVDRDALIQAAEAHDVQECSEIFASPERGTNRFGLMCSCGWRSEDMPKRDKVALDRMVLSHRLDAILALIADAIEARGQQHRPGSEYREGLIDGHWRAARLVRSLLGTDSDR